MKPNEQNEADSLHDPADEAQAPASTGASGAPTGEAGAASGGRASSGAGVAAGAGFAEDASAAAGAGAPSRPAQKASPAARRRKALLATLAVLALIAAVLLLIRAFVPGADGWLDPAAEQGRYEGWDEQAVRDDLSRQVEEGMMAVSVSSSIVFEDGTSEGEARIENVPGNRVDQKVVLTLDDTGEALYESGALAPGTHVQRIRLSRDLEPGDYAATAVFTGYDRETHEKRGSAGVQVMLHVLN